MQPEKMVLGNLEKDNSTRSAVVKPLHIIRQYFFPNTDRKTVESSENLGPLVTF